MENQLALQKRISEVVAEYEEKLGRLDAALADHEAAGEALKIACSIGGTYGRQNIDTGNNHIVTLKRNLLTSAWLNVYEGANLKKVMSAKDKNLFEQSLADPAPFTIDNIKASFGDYWMNPRENILRALAEVFSDLDPAFKSHEKMKIGVKGLPKRVIIRNVDSIYGYGFDKVKDIVTALAQYQEIDLPDHEEINNLIVRGACHIGKDDKKHFIKRGLTMKTYQNGNAHLYFDKVTLVDINKALAEYYGDVLPDEASERKAHTSTELAKDLQYYPTPQAVIDRVLSDIYVKDKNVLEPSCGDGRIMEAIIREGGRAYGIEVDAKRCEEARAKGLNVMQHNFLRTVARPDFDLVIMNPPFYGKHYEKHVRHALKFLEEGGGLIAILPITARYDHKLLDDLNGRWFDLPIGSFRESGTNINTTIFQTWR